MRYIYILCFSLLTCHTLSATHIIGGSISYKKISPALYEVRLEVLRDCLNGDPTAPFDDPASLGLFVNGNLFKEHLIGFPGSDTLSVLTTSSSCIFIGNVCVEKTVYIDIIYLPHHANGYTIA